MLDVTHHFSVRQYRKRDIRGGTEHDELYLVRVFCDLFENKVDRASVLRLSFRADYALISHTVKAVYGDRFLSRLYKRSFRADIDRRFASARFKRHKRVVSRLLYVDVSGDDRNA